MKKFEYKRVTVAADNMSNLDLLGRQGWQVVHGTSQRKVDDYLLMREMIDVPDAYELAAKAMAESHAAVRQMAEDERKKNKCALCPRKWTRKVHTHFGEALVCEDCFPKTRPVEPLEILCHKCGVFAADHKLDDYHYCVHCLINRVEVFASMLTEKPAKAPTKRIISSPPPMQGEW